MTEGTCDADPLELLVARRFHLWQFTGPMRLRSKLPAILLLALAMLPGTPVAAQEKKATGNQKKPVPAKPSTPSKKPTPAKPAAKPATPAAPSEVPSAGAKRTGAADGFRVDWTSFVRGHDLNLDTFFSEKKPGSSISALLGISRSHLFGDEAPAGGEDKFHAFTVEMPPPPVTQDAPKAIVEKDSETGKLLGSKLGWTRGHLCWLTVAWEGGAKPMLKIKAYQPYAK